MGPETGRRFPASPVKSVSPPPEQTGSSGHGGRYPTRGETGQSSSAQCEDIGSGRFTTGMHSWLNRQTDSRNSPSDDGNNQPGSFLSLVRRSMKTHTQHHDSLRSGTNGGPSRHCCATP